MIEPGTISTTSDETIASADGLPLKAWCWSRPSPRGVLVIAHGLGEHGGCYRHVADAVGHAADVDVLAFDFRGHGRSPGRRGLVRTFSELEADLCGALAWAERTRPGLPRFVLGHSNGGLVALRVLLDQSASLAGLIVSNPALGLAQPVPWYKGIAGAIFRRLAPGVTLDTGVGSESMTRDPEMLAERKADPLRHTRICSAIFYAMTEGGPIVSQRGGEITSPTLVLLSGADPVINTAETRALFDRIAFPDKTMRLYPGMLHEPLNDLGREQVLADISDWLIARLH
jgi:alpha-beta hydrolase superfamily lysophospholipase